MQAAFTILLEKYLTGELSEGEKGLLQEMMQDPQYEETALQYMREAFEMMEPGPVKQEWTAKMEGKVMEQVRLQRRVPAIRKVTRYFAALVVLICIGAGAWLLLKEESKQPEVAVHQQQPNIAPVSSRAGAILALSNGTQIRLDSIADGTVATEGEVTVEKRADEIAYLGDREKDGNNTLRTPAGKRWSLRLSDGTKIWLNAASTITYPTSFAKDQRLVAITGEAYLEVAHDATRPFTVALPDGSTVKVLGTHFSVNAYPGEKKVQATLLEGSIAFEHGNDRVIIKPGEQAGYDLVRKTVEKAKADTSSVSAWRNGVLRFDNRDVTAVMRQLQRWYDIDVQYEGPISNSLYGGEMQVSLSLAEVIEVLHTMGIRCRLEGRRVTVTS